MASLAHYGIKGMRWGVTRADPSAHPTADRVDYKKGRVNNVILSKQREANEKASDDASRAAILKKVATKKSTDALSNKELQDLVTRMNLEQQYSRLTAPQGNSFDPGKMVKDILVQEGKKQLNKFVQDQMTKRVASAMGGKSNSGFKKKNRSPGFPDRLAIGG